MVEAADGGLRIRWGISNERVKKCSTQSEVLYLVDIHCLAHKFELGALDALKVNPQVSAVKEVLHGIYKHCERASKCSQSNGRKDPEAREPGGNTMVPLSAESTNSFDKKLWSSPCTLLTCNRGKFQQH